MPPWQAMFRFFQNTKRSLDSLLNLITDLVADGLLFFHLLFRSRTSLSVEVLFLRFTAREKCTSSAREI